MTVTVINQYFDEGEWLQRLTTKFWLHFCLKAILLALTANHFWKNNNPFLYCCFNFLCTLKSD